MTSPADALHLATLVVQLFSLKLAMVFIGLGSIFSAASLATAFVVAFAVTAQRRRARGRAVRVRVVLRALFPRGLFRRPSTRADFWLFLFNVLLAGGLTGAAILSAQTVQGSVSGALGSVAAGGALAGAPGWLAAAASTLAVFLAFEFGYYVDHWLSHNVPALWAAHKVHHTAQTLTPMSNFRMHPIDSLVFMNIAAVFTGSAAGLCLWLFGPKGEALTLGGGNLIFVGLWFAFGHLQHTHLWITFPQPLGRWFITPAHHQLHHSMDPAHHGKNLGSFLSLFDWTFGTLLHPTKQRQALSFGVEGDQARHHTITGALVDPVTEGLASLVPEGVRPYARSFSRA